MDYSRVVVIGPFLAVLGCGPMQETIHDVQSALELPFGGYTFEEEMPFFGRPELDVAPVNPRLPVEQSGGRSLGVVVGLWRDMAKGHGVMLGKWADDQGRVIGHIKGIYGRSRRLRDWVYFGKLASVQGYARALMKGRFSHGVFQGTLYDPKGQTIGYIDGISSRDNLVHQGSLAARLNGVEQEAQLASRQGR